jgi:hypothetical protein
VGLGMDMDRGYGLGQVLGLFAVALNQWDKEWKVDVICGQASTQFSRPSTTVHHIQSHQSVCYMSRRHAKPIALTLLRHTP